MSQLRMVYADERGRIYDSPSLRALGRTGTDVAELEPEEWMPLPACASLVALPGTRALGTDSGGLLRALPASCSAVGVLLPQGFTRLYLPAFHRDADAPPLPLFGYTAVGFSRGRFYAAAVQSDDPRPWDPLQYEGRAVARQVDAVRERFPGNRLYTHLSRCALEYECITARNTFFFRNEAALPVSAVCNAGCVGCISEQPDEAGFPSPQVRLAIRPTVGEMVELMAEHLRAGGPDAIVSFGQGCEGEPAVRAREIAAAIRAVRERIRSGYININTNAGFTDGIRRIADAGLDLMRVSIVSALADHYDAYYRPRGYALEDVERSAACASERGVIVSLNYLIFPGVSDREREIRALAAFIRRTGVKLVQLRNLNIDPDYYLARIPPLLGEQLGILAVVEELRRECPGLRIGSFTHPARWFADPENRAPAESGALNGAAQAPSASPR